MDDDSGNLFLHGDRSELEEYKRRLRISRRLSTEEYTNLLYEAQKNALLHLCALTHMGQMKGMKMLVECVEKLHWLIDSVEKKYGRPDQINVFNFNNLSTPELLKFRSIFQKATGKELEEQNDASPNANEIQ